MLWQGRGHRRGGDWPSHGPLEGNGACQDEALLHLRWFRAPGGVDVER
jgi:hypothetical protein